LKRVGYIDDHVAMSLTPQLVLIACHRSTPANNKRLHQMRQATV